MRTMGPACCAGARARPAARPRPRRPLQATPHHLLRPHRLPRPRPARAAAAAPAAPAAPRPPAVHVRSKSGVVTGNRKQPDHEGETCPHAARSCPAHATQATTSGISPCAWLKAARWRSSCPPCSCGALHCSTTVPRPRRWQHGKEAGRPAPARSVLRRGQQGVLACMQSRRPNAQ